MANKLYRQKVSFSIFNLLFKGKDGYIFMEGFIFIWIFGGVESYFKGFAGGEIIQSSMQTPLEKGGFCLHPQ